MNNRERLKGRWAFHFKKCISCGRTDRKHSGKGLCVFCKMKTRKEYIKNWYQKNKKRVLKHHREYHKINRIYFISKQKERYNRVRKESLGMYGNKCVCCGEAKEQFLTFDHINNDGKKHRKEIKGRNIIFWLRENDYPKEFQILCYNCNIAKGHYGKCPHQK